MLSQQASGGQATRAGGRPASYCGLPLAARSSGLMPGSSPTLIPPAALRHVGLGTLLHTAPALAVAPGSAGARRGALAMAAATRKGGSGASGRDAAAPVMDRVEDKELHNEASESYLQYAMSVIAGRALPDVRDGLKPVHRRILYAMHELGLVHHKPFKKCARVVGEVLGKFHPHGDSAVYDAMVRLAQDFSMREPLVDGHGNFGSVDDDPPAAMRYTECRLRQVASEMLLQDLDAGTVDFAATFDASQLEPVVLPARVPHLLINGTQGIAVGIATRILPHNLKEVVSGLCALIRNPSISTQELMQHVPAPDFPTGGQIVVGPELVAAYESGIGSVCLRATVTEEDAASAKGGGAATRARRGTGNGSGAKLLVIHEIPYQSCKAELVSRIAHLIESKAVDGVADVRDESDRYAGLRVVVELRPGAQPEVVLGQLMKLARLQQRVPVHSVALVGAAPKTLGLKEILVHFLDFRCEVVSRRTSHALRAAEARLHLVEGFLKAMESMDAIVEAVRAATDGGMAKGELQKAHGLSEEQAEAVLGLTLRRMSRLEAGKLQEERDSLVQDIARCQHVLSDRTALLEIVEREAVEVADKFGSPRRTQVLAPEDAVDYIAAAAAAPRKRKSPLAAGSAAASAPSKPCLLLASLRGALKRMPVDSAQAQTRGSRGKSFIKLRESDSVSSLVRATTHSRLLVVGALGHAWACGADTLPEASAGPTVGTPVAQVLQLSKSQDIVALLPLGEEAEQHTSNGNGNGSSSEDGEGEAGTAASGGPTVVLLSQGGQIKRIAVPRPTTKLGVKVASWKGGESDTVGWAELSHSERDGVLTCTASGYCLLVPASEINLQSTNAGGTKAMSLGSAPTVDRLVALQVLPESMVGPVQHRPAGAQKGGKHGEGADGSAPSAAAGAGAGGSEEASLLLLTEQGMGNRLTMSQLEWGRRSQRGPKLFKLAPGDKLAAALLVRPGDDVLIASRRGVVARVAADSVSMLGPNEEGGSVVALDEGDAVATMAVLPAAV